MWLWTLGMRRLLLCVALLAVGCGTAPVGGEAEGLVAQDEEAMTIKKGVVVLTAEQAQNATVEADSVTVPQGLVHSLKTIAAGDFLVSGEGDGFLRRVVSVESNDALRMQTVDALLTDIVINGSLHTSLALDPIVLDLSGQANIGTEDLGVAVTPFMLSVTPTVDLDIVIKKSSVRTFSTRVRYERTTSLGFSANAKAPASFDTGDIKLWQSPKWRFVQSIGPIPIVEVVSVTVAAGLQGEISAAASLTMEGSCDHTQSYTLGYKNGEWQNNQSGDTTCTPVETDFSAAIGNIALQPYLKGTLAVDFYGIAGPYLSLSDGLLGQIATCPSPAEARLDDTARLAIGADLKKLGGKKYEATIVAAAFPIKRWSVDTSAICH
jgi:hypothetical protein